MTRLRQTAWGVAVLLGVVLAVLAGPVGLALLVGAALASVAAVALRRARSGKRVSSG